MNRGTTYLWSVIALASVAGCGSPNAANNKLRIENQTLQDQLDGLKREKVADHATIEALQSKVGTLPTLPQDRLDKLFTTAGLKLGRLTGGDPTDPALPGDKGLRIEAVPLDQEGQSLKAAGSFTIDAFDLSQSDAPRIGHWAFSVEQARANWYGSGMLYGYIMKCPWQKVPTHPELTLKVTFHDELTGREIAQQKVVKVALPTTTP